MYFHILSYLPNDILNIIFEYISARHKIFLNKKYYIKFNYLIDQIIGSKYESYIRDIIRNDCAFVFSYILNKQFKKWLTIKNYHYKQCIYCNFIRFLIDYSRENHAFKCCQLLNVQLQLSGLKKDWCKNNRIKYNKWTI